MKKLLLAFAFLVAPFGAQAQPDARDCGSYTLADRFYREAVEASLVWYGRIDGDTRMELRVLGDKGRPWVLLVVKPAEDHACVVEGGNGWEAHTPWPKGGV